MTGPVGDSAAERLRQRLEPWPGPVEHQSQVTSTNDILRSRARAGAPAWSVLMADQQTAGRGRQDHTWLSPPGSLALSVLLRPSWTATVGLVLPLAAGVAVAEALAAHSVAVQLKWPNDVVLGGRKLGGILVEAAVAATAFEWAVVGIGLNLAVDRTRFPDALRDAATSVEAVGLRSPPDALEIAAGVLLRLRAWCAVIDQGGGAPVIAAWERHAVSWWGHPVEARDADGVIVGIARGLDARGAFVIERPDGTRMALLSADVRELRVRPPEMRG